MANMKEHEITIAVHGYITVTVEAEENATIEQLEDLVDETLFDYNDMASVEWYGVWVDGKEV